MLKVNFIADGSSVGNLHVDRVKERIQQDIKTAHGILSSCHNDAVNFSLLLDTNAVNFSGKITCSCKQDLAKYIGNTNDFRITYTEIKKD